jgi:hypothetical protein
MITMFSNGKINLYRSLVFNGYLMFNINVKEEFHQWSNLWISNTSTKVKFKEESWIKMKLAIIEFESKTCQNQLEMNKCIPIKFDNSTSFSFLGSIIYWDIVWMNHVVCLGKSTLKPKKTYMVTFIIVNYYILIYVLPFQNHGNHGKLC